MAKYWTILPPKAELEAKLGELVREVQDVLPGEASPLACSTTPTDRFDSWAAVRNPPMFVG